MIFRNKAIIKTTMYSFIVLLLFSFLLIGCDCKLVQTVEERYVDVIEEVYETERYYVKEPYFDSETKLVEAKVRKLQEIEFNACGEFLRISNPSDESVTITFKTDQLGQIMLHSKHKLRKDASSDLSYIIPAKYANGFSSWAKTSTQAKIKANSYIDLEYTGLHEDQTITCKDIDGMPCNSYDECDKKIGNNIFNIDTIKKLDIKIENPKVTTISIFEESNNSVKKYKLVPYNRTIIKDVKSKQLRNVTINKKVCS